MNDTILRWAAQYGVPLAVVQELLRTLAQETLPSTLTVHGGGLEAGVQQRVRFRAAEKGAVLWRNNVGEMKDANGNHVRYGLCNDSQQLNSRYKSSDLIGMRPVLITADMVGSTLGQFVARECKREGWQYAGTPREQAQMAFLQLVNSKGGDATFTTGEY